MANEVFISYSRKDYNKVREIKDVIDREVGINCWIDLDGIESHEQFVNVIVNAINSHEMMLFMMSDSSMQSKWTLNELSLAERRKKRIVLVKIDNAEMPDDFYFLYRLKDQIEWNDSLQRGKLLRNLKSWHYTLKKRDDDFEIEYSLEELDTLIQQHNIGKPNQPFILPVEDVFYITGRGVVVTGRIESCKIKMGDELIVIGLGKRLSTKCLGIEMSRKLVNEACSGDNVGLLLEGLDKTDTLRGQVVVHQSNLSNVSNSQAFSCDCYFLEDEKYGKNYEIASTQQLQFYIRTADVSGKFELPNGVVSIKPNDYLPLKVLLIVPFPLNKGLVFTICVDNNTIGVGVVKKVL